jgi:hypothetical protein
MNSPSSSQNQAITLTIQGCENVVSFKNSKLICAPKGRRPMLITDPKKQKKMDRYIGLIESQLHSLYQTSETGMATGCSLASWIQSCVPLDDSRKWIPELHVYFKEVPKGDEGAVILIEKL